MQYGNAYSSLDDIVGTYGDITSSPGMIGRLRAQQDYKAYMDNLDKRTDLSEDYKNYYRTVNKYNYQDVTDKMVMSLVEVNGLLLIKKFLKFL